MKETITFLLAIICQTLLAQNKDIEMITKLNSDWLGSYSKKEAATLDRIFAPDFVLVSPNGTKMTKQDILNNLTKQEVLSVSVDSMDVKLLTNDVGVVTAYTTFVLSVEGTEKKGRNCYQDIYVKRRGKWVAVTAHVTLLNFE